jgi:hypothetical protein
VRASSVQDIERRFSSVAIVAQIAERPGRKVMRAQPRGADTPILPSSEPQPAGMTDDARDRVGAFTSSSGGASARCRRSTAMAARDRRVCASEHERLRRAPTALRELSTYYVIDVADPPVRRSSDLRELEVKVLRRGVTVRARRAIPGR